MVEPAGVIQPGSEARTRPPRVLAIVVTHRGKEWVRECLVSLARQEYPILDVLVIDDASPDSRQQPVLRRIVKRHMKGRVWGYVRTPRPLGYGGAINWALSRVRTSADLLLFLHDDVKLEDGAVTAMVRRIASDPEIAIVGPKVVGYDDPMRLEEVGMHADLLGYPYKGLEEGEIDLGQRDSTSETFYVTSTCMLVRAGAFRELKGWDVRLRAFAEDLDLCWRARLAGYRVAVATAAKVGHAMALATGQRASPFKPVRYYSRRNRLRTVFKNAAGLRLLVLVPQFVLVTFAEMLAFILLRQPHEIANLARALGWNFLRLPQTFSERARIQHRRKVSDLRLRRYRIHQRTRLRAYLAGQRERFEEAWGRRAELVAERSAHARVLGLQLRGWVGVTLVFGALAFALGFRHIWLSGPVALGDMLPFPDGALSMWTAYSAPWRAAGLGDAGPGPVALALLGLFQVAALGSAGAAQKLLVLVLGLAAFTGAYSLVADLVDRRGRVAAGLAYMLGGVGYAGLRGGALGALVLGAAAPFALRAIIRLLGWSRPPAWSRNRTVARLALSAAISAAFVPGSLFLYLLVAVVLFLLRLVLAGRERRGFVTVVAGLGTGWALLLPWSAAWLARDGGPLYLLWGDESWRRYAAGFSGHDATSVLLGQTPEAPVLLGLALPLFGLVALFGGVGQRRRMALGLWGVIVAAAWIGALTADGLIRPLVASPTELGVVPSLAFSALVGLAVGAFRLDLPRRGFGALHWLVLLFMSGALFLAATGLAPALFHGEWRPDPEGTGEAVDQVRQLMAAEAAVGGPFRALWVGDAWAGGGPSAARSPQSRFLSGEQGPVLSDLFDRPLSPADRELNEIVDAIEVGATDRGGGLLGTFNIRYVILERGDSEDWLVQRDLALVRTETDYFLFENSNLLPRVAVYDRLPAEVAIEGDAGPRAQRRETLERISADEYRTERVSEGVIFVAEDADDGWVASIEGRRLARVEGTWGNAFGVPLSGGPVVAAVPRSQATVVWLVLVTIAWVVVISASFARGVSPPTPPRAGSPPRMPVPPPPARRMPYGDPPR